MTKSLISKALAIFVTQVVFSIVMYFSGQSVGSGPAIAKSLKWLSFFGNEQYGICTLIVIAFMANSVLKRVL